uniref:Ribonucleases P/MRP protein subunit POP1 n=1 Tax=Strongyloides stercoralis TaxID=6248 RepID=A0A0K0EN05_STRER
MNKRRKTSIQKKALGIKLQNLVGKRRKLTKEKNGITSHKKDDFKVRSSNILPEYEDNSNVRKKRKFTTPEMRKIFDNFNTKSHIHKGVRLHACGYLLDSLFLLGLTKGVEADFIDYTFLGIRTLLHKPYEKNFEKTHNIKVFSMETITTTELEKTLKISNYEPIEDIGHLFANMSIDVAEKSKRSYIERCNEAEKYKKEYKSEMLRRRKNKIVIDVGNQDLSERCFVLSYNFRPFKDKKDINSLQRYTKKDAKNVLLILNFLLQSYTEEAVADAIGILMDTYKEAVTFFQRLSPISLNNTNTTTDMTTNQSHINVVNKNMDKKTPNEKFDKENNISFIDVYYEPTKKRIKKLSTSENNKESILLMPLQAVENNNTKFNLYKRPYIKNGDTIYTLEPKEFLNNDKLKKILFNTDINELAKTSKPFPDGIILTVQVCDKTFYKYKMYLNNKKVIKLLRKIEINAMLSRSELFLIKKRLYNKEIISLEDNSSYVNGRCLRIRKEMSY